MVVASLIFPTYDAAKAVLIVSTEPSVWFHRIFQEAAPCRPEEVDPINDTIGWS